jgi:L1 cell adhesion molecule like protein
VLQLITEPTAAALAYTLQENVNSHQKILVFDLGGGTYDISVLEVEKGKIRVKGISGDTHLGGQDFDRRLVSDCVEQCERMKIASKDAVLSNPRALQKLKHACEQAKVDLSAAEDTAIYVDSLIDGKDFSTSITRARFEQLNIDYFDQKLKKPIEDALSMAGFDKTEIDQIIMIGGSSKIPKVQSTVSEFFNEKQLNLTVNPDEAVAYGAAIHAASLVGKGETSYCINEVIPLSLGVDIVGNKMMVIIPRGTMIPCTISDKFVTAYDYQEALKFSVLEGERPLASENHALGAIIFSKLPPRLRGDIKCEITFEIDVNGVLSVKSVRLDNAEIKEAKFKLDKGRLTEDEIQHMIEQAKYMAEHDQKEQKRFKAKSELEVCAYSLKNKLKRGQIPKEKTSKVSLEVNKVLEWIESNPSATRESYEEQFKILHKFSRLSVEDNVSLMKIIFQWLTSVFNRMAYLQLFRLRMMTPTVYYAAALEKIAFS